MNDGNVGQVVGQARYSDYRRPLLCHVEGDIENVNGVLKITRIKVTYSLKIPSGKTDDARQAFEQYLPYCPGAQSVIGSIHIEHDLKIEEDKSN